jgi:hypothetical protein
MQLSNIVINWKNYILEDSYLPHRDDVLLTLHQVLHHFLVMPQRFIILVTPTLAGPMGCGSGGRTLLLGITPMIHHPIAQRQTAIKVSIIN